MGRRECVLGAGGGGAVAPVRVRWVGCVGCGCFVGVEDVGWHGFDEAAFVVFECCGYGLLHDFGTEEEGILEVVPLGCEVFFGGFGLGYGEEGGDVLGLVLEPFVDGGGVCELFEGGACGVDGLEDAVVGDGGEEALEEEVGEVVVGVLDGGGGCVGVVGVAEEGVGGVGAGWHEAGVVEGGEFAVGGGLV